MKLATMKAVKRHLVLAGLALGTLAMPGTALAKDYTVSIANMSFGKALPDLKVGDTITWVNNDSVPHTVTARNKSFNLRADRGKSVKLTLTKAGTIAYYCIYHPMMRGTLKVAAK